MFHVPFICQSPWEGGATGTSTAQLKKQRGSGTLRLCTGQSHSKTQTPNRHPSEMEHKRRMVGRLSPGMLYWGSDGTGQPEALRVLREGIATDQVFRVFRRTNGYEG